LTSDTGNDFEAWLAGMFDRDGAFTALIVLVRIGETSVTPLCSTFVNVIGSEAAWSDIVLMLAGSGQDWDGAAFFPRRDDGPLDNNAARRMLRALELRLDADPLVLNEGHFFDRWGRRMRVDEVSPP